jgi:gliding motility-associated-like protein
MEQLRVLLLSFFFGLTPELHAQQGVWTWMHGSTLLNEQGVFGTKGIPSSGNDPPGLYEACEWTDHAGKFWLFGGAGNSGQHWNTLWMFDPDINMWTWMNGSSYPGSLGVYGTQGIPASGNGPGGRGWGMATWVDASGNLWLFGGEGFDGAGGYGVLNDLWKYTIKTNTWTWMSGSSIANDQGFYGTMNVPDVLNSPPARRECNATWSDPHGDLWIFGGQSESFNNLNDLWKFDVSMNQWVWMHGSNSLNPSGSYGTKDIPSPTNDPPGRWVYSKFKDALGNFWIYGGSDGISSFNDLWKYDPVAGMWTWMKGSDITGDLGIVGTACEFGASNLPASRLENRACWTDACGDFYTFGGMRDCNWNKTYNDLWHYNVANNEWTMIGGSSQGNPAGSWGSILVPAASNVPDGRCGSQAFQDKSGNLWLFGGTVTGLINRHNDLWRFVPDSTCGLGRTCLQVLDTKFSASVQNGCAPAQIYFTNNSMGANTYTWTFGDGYSSNAKNPVHVYGKSGTYAVSLYVSNGTVSDSLIKQSYIILDSCLQKACGDVYVPNYFSPNNDGVNDLLCVYGPCIQTISFSVYDRWGEKVFETNEPKACWDGYYRGELMNSGEFVYYLYATLITGEIITQKGTVIQQDAISKRGSITLNR